MASGESDWSQEVIAAAFRITKAQQEAKDDNIAPSQMEEDEGIASDDSSLNASSSCAPSLSLSPAESPTSSTDSARMLDASKAQRRKPSSKHKIRPKSACPDLEKNQNQRNLVGFLRGLVNSKSREIVTQEANRLFGRNLIQYLEETKQKVPTIVRVCAECIERYGVIDGIYRLSGISSNIRALKVSFESISNNNESELEKLLQSPEFDWRQFPMLSPEHHLTQQGRTKPDVHSISSLLKLYFRELPEPLCTYNLYQKFMASAQMPLELKLGAVREVVALLPKEHFNTLEYLMRHLCKVSQRGHETGMTSKNLSIVWAPNLLRSRADDGFSKAGGCTNLKDIGLQAVCTEFLIRYPDLIFTSNLPTFSAHTFELGILAAGTNQPEIDIDRAIAKRLPPPTPLVQNNSNASAFSSRRPKSLSIVTDTHLISEIELNEKLLVICKENDKPKFIEVGGGPSALPRDFHTEVKLRRAKSSTIAGGNCMDQRHLDINSSVLSNKSVGLKHRLFHFPRKDRHSRRTFSSSSIHIPTTTADCSEQPSSLVEIQNKRHSKATFYNPRSNQPESLPLSTNSVEMSPSQQQQQQQWRRNQCKSVDSLTFKNSNIFTSKRPNSSSSEASETDVDSEVNKIKLNFDQEEFEMRMMNCCFDDNLNSSSSSAYSTASTASSASPGRQGLKEQVDSKNKHAPLAAETAPTTPSTPPDLGSLLGSDSWESSKVSLQLQKNEILEKEKSGVKTSPESSEKKRSNKIDKNKSGDASEKIAPRSGQARDKLGPKFSFRMFRMTGIFSSQNKVKKDTAGVDSSSDKEDISKPSVTETEKISLADAMTCTNKNADSSLPQNKDQQGDKLASKKMETITEELDFAFENKIYNNVPVIGPGSEPTSNYENVLIHANVDQFYENVNICSNYENVGKESYENFCAGKPSKNDQLSYQNVNFQPTNKPRNTQTFYQNVNFVNSPSEPISSFKALETNNNCIVPKKDTLKDAPSYENFDFEEEGVYQNMIVTQNNRLVPATQTSIDAQAKSRRQTKARQSRARSSPATLAVPTSPQNSTTADDDIYMKVRALRRSVQEVNALIESDASSTAITTNTPTPKSTTRTVTPLPSTTTIEPSTRTTNLSTVGETKERKDYEPSAIQERSTNFRAILTRFNSIGVQPTTSPQTALTATTTTTTNSSEHKVVSIQRSKFNPSEIKRT